MMIFYGQNSHAVSLGNGSNLGVNSMKYTAGAQCPDLVHFSPASGSETFHLWLASSTVYKNRFWSASPYFRLYCYVRQHEYANTGKC